MTQPLHHGKALMRNLFRKLGFAVVVATGLTLGEAGARDEQVAHAASWQLWGSPQGAYCEGCCRPGTLCCEVNFPCSVTPVDS
jgi:hypothetical protein